MKTTLLIAAFAALVSAQAARLDGVAAQVDQKTITRGDVVAEMQRRHFKTFDDALKSLIDRKLILKAAAEKKMEMQEWVVDNRVREIVHDNFGDDRNKLDAELAKSRVSMADWRKTIRDDMIVNAMRWQIVDKNLTPTPAQMRAEYDNNPGRYMRGASTTVRVILLRPASGSTPSVQTRAEEVLGRLDAGESFAELAKKYSADSHAADGGLWKDVDPKESFRAEIADAIAALKPGAHSGLVELDGWGFIVLKESEAKSEKRSFFEAYEDIVYNVRRTVGRKAYDEWVARLRSEAFVKIYPVADAK